MSPSWVVILLASLVAIVYTRSVGLSDAARYRVVVVGAGVSGFTTAAKLLENNVTDVIVLEAANRVGGRIRTVEFGGVPLDLGAQFVHGQEDNVVYDMLKPYDMLTSYDALITPDKFLFANLTGTGYPSIELAEAISAAFNIYDDPDSEHFNGSITDFLYSKLHSVLEPYNVSSDTEEALKYFLPLGECLSTGCETDLSEVSTHSFNEYWMSEGDQSLTWKKGTGKYKTIFDFISKKFPNPREELPVLNKTLLNKEVTRVAIRPEGGRVEVNCADGSTYIADHVVSTVSLGVLKKHHSTLFQPPLPENKINAIKMIGFGCVAKVFMLFPTRWWPVDTNIIVVLFSDRDRETFKATSNHGSWTSNSTGFMTVVSHDRMLITWLSGEACRMVERLSDSDVTDGLMELLNAAVGKQFTIPRPEAILKTDWASNPHVLGVYSYLNTSGSETNLDVAQPILQDDKPVLLFAGEATHPRHHATVHGAIETGRREATRLLDYFRTTSTT